VKKICLCMIVKNEAAIIERCLDSAKPVLDYAFIIDTGSTDGTQQLISGWLKNNGIEGQVFEEPFQNFGYNRTSAVNHASAAYPDADYLLILDADEVLEVQPGFSKGELKADSYMTLQYNRSLKYWYHRLLGTAKKWECVGVTHEYWHAKGAHSTGKLSTLTVKDFGDGGSKGDKFIRDEKLLLEALKDQNLDAHLKARYLFYLANTYHDTSKFEKAILWYQQRIAAGGWPEEVYYSYYRIGECYRAMFEHGAPAEKAHNFAKAACAYLDAWNYHPSRAEPLYELSRLYRQEKKYHLATLYASLGSEIPYPVNDVLFISYPVYDYLLDYELSISSYYVDKEKARKKQKELEKRTDLPIHIKETIKRNARYY